MVVAECATKSILSYQLDIFPAHFFIFFASTHIPRTCPKSDPRFRQLVQRVTQNFDTFEDFGSNLDSESKTRVHKNALDQFYDYSYRRVRKPRVPLPDHLDGISEE